MFMPAVWLLFSAVTCFMMEGITFFAFCTFMALKAQKRFGEDFKDNPAAMPFIKKWFAVCLVALGAESDLWAIISAMLCGHWYCGVGFFVLAAWQFKCAIDIWTSGRRKKPAKFAGRVIDLGHKLAVSPT